MSEEIDIDTIIEELEQENEDNVEDHHAEVIEEAEGKAEREDKVARKISKSYEELDKKMDAIELQRVMDKFDDSSDDTEKLIMGTVRATKPSATVTMKIATSVGAAILMARMNAWVSIGTIVQRSCGE